MPSKCQQVIELIENIAPKNLAEEWDNVGLHLGAYNMEVSKVLVTLDIDGELVEEAIVNGVNLIISHHPFIFTPLKNIRWDDYKGKLIKKLITHNIGVYCAHTNIDISNKGINYWLGKKLGLQDIQPLAQLFSENLYKYVIYVPQSYKEDLVKALGDLGAGFIGNYSHCIFSSSGIGTFKPTEGAKPFIGSINKLEHVEESRIETIVREKDLSRITKKINKIHPYEEVAYDIYPLENKGNIQGLGIKGSIDPVDTDEFLNHVKKSLDLSTLRIAGAKPRKITNVALCTGAGVSEMRNAKYAGAHVFITGDVKYHDAQLAKELGIFLIDAGHYATEKIFIESMTSYLLNEITVNSMKVEIIPSHTNRDYIQLV